MPANSTNSANFHYEFEFIHPFTEGIGRMGRLRQTLIHAENPEVEPTQSHYGLFDGETIVALVIVAPMAPGEIKFRQMAVDPSRQGQGCGRRLLEAVEAQWRARGTTRFVLHARLTAAAF